MKYILRKRVQALAVELSSFCRGLSRSVEVCRAVELDT